MTFYISKQIFFSNTNNNKPPTYISISKQYDKLSNLSITSQCIRTHNKNFDITLQNYPSDNNISIIDSSENQNTNISLWNFISTIQVFCLLSDPNERSNLSKKIYVNKGSCDKHGIPMHLDLKDIQRFEDISKFITSYRLFQVHGSEVIFKA